MEIDGGVTVPRDSLLIFLDDTGEEKLGDPQFKVFGYGGIIVTARRYADLILNPWNEVLSTFPKERQPLHAADLKLSDISTEQLEALDSFFGSVEFDRFACTYTLETVDRAELARLETVFISIHDQFVPLAGKYAWTSIEMFMESSPHQDRERDLLETFQPRFPIQRRFFQKGLLAGLDVADFVAHTAGSSVNDEVVGKRKSFATRPDFIKVFRDIDPSFCSFRRLDNLKANYPDIGQGVER